MMESVIRAGSTSEDLLCAAWEGPIAKRRPVLIAWKEEFEVQTVIAARCPPLERATAVAPCLTKPTKGNLLLAPLQRL